MSLRRQPDQPAVRGSGDRWRAHLRSCAICREAERTKGLYCMTGTMLYRAWRTAMRLQRRLRSTAGR